MTVNAYLICISLLIAKLTNVETKYSYPIKRTTSPYSFTVYQNKKVNDGIRKNKEETHTSYQNCVSVCYNNINWCKSIAIKVLNISSFYCQFFDYIPITYISDGAFFISTTPPRCSRSCNLTLNPCGSCDCNPSCSADNRRQHICNCTRAAGVAKSCQEHYDRGFIKTGIFQINPHDTLFQTVCEMEKIEQQNPVIDYQCDLKNIAVKYAVYQSFTMYSTSYCFEWCVSRREQHSYIDMVLYWQTGCSCVDYYSTESFDYYPTRFYTGSYCYIVSNQQQTSCNLLYTQSWEGLNYYYDADVPYDPSRCVSTCKNYQLSNPTLNGYVASGIVVNSWQCMCLYGNGNNYVNQYGCSFQINYPAQTLPSSKGVWIPMMTRFDNWDSFFWQKSFKEYENGFGLLNQQWIGLKKLNEITSSFTTDMRVDYTFKDDVAFSVMYYHVKIYSSEYGYAFDYISFNLKNTFDTNPFVERNTSFKECGWWTTACNWNTYYPTSTNTIQFGSVKDLKSIQFLLSTK